MADATAEVPTEKSGNRMVPILIALVLTLLVGGGGFYVSYSGIFPPVAEAVEEEEPKVETSALPDVVFVPLDPILVNLAGPGETRFVRFSAELEVPSSYDQDVLDLMPRILDILNGYLRAVSLEDVQKPTALLTLRAHMLRRVELVVGPDRVSDLLITEFVVN